jgi:cytochrome c peroxidase
VLFYDSRLSANDTTACASCHLQRHAFADPKRFSVGFAGRLTDRHAPNLTGLRYNIRARFFWDERGGNLEDMVLLPILSSIEMGMDLSSLPGKLGHIDDYPALFRRAFGDPAVTERRIALALAQFLRSLVSYRSRYDQGIAHASSVMAPFANFTRQENHGKALFVRSCARCHLPGEEHDFFGRVPGDNRAGAPARADGGLGDVTLNAQDFGVFKSPSLRNVAVAGPYMHDGSLATLDEVIDHYSRNAAPQAPLRFTDSEKRALVAFMHTLTDHDFLHDPRFSDPFLPPAVEERVAREVAAPPAVPGPARSSIEDAIARVMGFDQDADGHVLRHELPERMHDIVARGDRNRSGGLDRHEVRALASSEVLPGRGVALTRVAANLRPAPEPTAEALLDDLGLGPASHDAALTAMARDREERSGAAVLSVARLRDEVQPLLDANRLLALTSALDRQVRGPVRVSRDQGGMPILLPVVDVDRTMSGWSLRPPTQDAVQAAVAAHRQRISVLATDPEALLRRLESILTSAELDDFAAAARRHRPALLTGTR